MRKALAIGGAVLLTGVVVGLGWRVLEDLSADTPASAARAVDEGFGVAGSDASRHGADYARVPEPGVLLVCDEEADGNPVRARAEVHHEARRWWLTVEDRDGANGRCVRVPVEGEVLRVRTCERNHLFWDCGNDRAPEHGGTPVRYPGAGGGTALRPS
jgi:hypothetical protein